MAFAITIISIQVDFFFVLFFFRGVEITSQLANAKINERKPKVIAGHEKLRSGNSCEVRATIVTYLNDFEAFVGDLKCHFQRFLVLWTLN